MKKYLKNNKKHFETKQKQNLFPINTAKRNLIRFLLIVDVDVCGKYFQILNEACFAVKNRFNKEQKNFFIIQCYLMACTNERQRLFYWNKKYKLIIKIDVEKLFNKKYQKIAF